MKIRERLTNPPDRLWSSSSWLILGKPGSGKTRLASTVGRSKPDDYCYLLPIDPDNGSGGQKFYNPAIIPDNFDEVISLLSLVEQAVRSQDPPYKIRFYNHDWQFNGVMIDTLNRLQDVAKLGLRGSRFSKKQLQIQNWGELLDKLTDTILSLIELSSAKPFHTVLTAQIVPEKITIQTTKETDEQASEFYWLPSLQGSISKKLAEYVDCVVTCHFDPALRKFQIFGQDTVLNTGTYAGKLRYKDFFKGNTERLADSWVEILRQHSVDVDNPDKIGALDIPKQIDLEWYNSQSAQETIAAFCADNGHKIEQFFEFWGISEWADFAGTPEMTGKHAWLEFKTAQAK